VPCACAELVDILVCIRIHIAFEPTFWLQRLLDQQVLADDTLRHYGELVLVEHAIEQNLPGLDDRGLIYGGRQGPSAPTTCAQ